MTFSEGSKLPRVCDVIGGGPCDLEIPTTIDKRQGQDIKVC